jgi:nitroreductase
MIREASVGILVCADLNIQSNKSYCTEDCSASTQNILLAAHANGIGAVWLGVYPREKRIEGLKELLKLPENILPISLISLGYPDETKEVPQRYDESKIHYNVW